MLASILPGFREVRAPFAAGTLLLAALYVAAYDIIERAARPDRLGDGLAALSDLLGPRGRLTVATVVAYLLGTVFVMFVRDQTRRLHLSRLEQTTSYEYFDGSQRTLLLRWAAPFSRSSLRRLWLFVRAELGDEIPLEQVCQEILVGRGKQLLVANKDLYVEWDRLEAEAEFRDAIILPGAVFAATCIFVVDWALPVKLLAATMVLLLLGVLWVHARRLDREANSMYAHAVADEQVTTPSIDLYRALQEAAGPTGPEASPESAPPPDPAPRPRTRRTRGAAGRGGT